MSNNNNLTSRLKNRIDIEYPTETTDGAGGFTIIWDTLASVWAEIVSSRIIKDRELLIDKQLQDVRLYKIIIRYRNDVTTKMRIKYGARYFNIRSVVDPDQSKEILEVHAEDGVAI